MATLHHSVVSQEVAATADPQASPGNPERGDYNVTNGNGTVCLMARMGLQLNVTFTNMENKVLHTLNKECEVKTHFHADNKTHAHFTS